MRYEFDGVVVDTRAERVTRGHEIARLEPKAFRLLTYLLANRGRLVEKQELLDRVWEGVFVTEHALTRAVAQVRRALGDDARGARYIETVPTRGYRFIAEVTERSVEQGQAPAAAGAEGPAVQAGRVDRHDSAAASAPSVSGRTTLRTPVLALAALAVSLALVGGAWRTWGPPAVGRPGNRPIESIAVLPLTDLSADGSQRFLADGVTEALITELARNRTLRVIARGSATQADNGENATVAAQLGVDALIRGTVVRDNERIRIAVRLVRAGSDQAVWADTYDGSLGDVATLQHRIAEAIAGEVTVSLAPGREARTVSVDARAQELYMRGREIFYKGINSPYPDRATSLRMAIEKYDAAASIQPEWAAPHAAAAQAAHWMAETDPQRLFEESRARALHAIALDDSVAEAHGALGYVSAAYFRDFPTALREFARAVELDPSTSYRHGYAMALTVLGRFDEAADMYGRAEQIDPLAIVLKRNAASSRFLARDYGHAIARYEAIAESQPGPTAALGLARALTFAGRTDEASTICSRMIEQGAGAPARSGLVCALARGNRPQEARAAMAALAEEAGLPPLLLARAHACLGDTEAALGALERADAARTPWLAEVNVDPVFDGLRRDARFQALLRRLGVPER